MLLTVSLSSSISPCARQIADGDNLSSLCDRPDLVSGVSGEVIDDGGELAPSSLDVENVGLASEFADVIMIVMQSLNKD